MGAAASLGVPESEIAIAVASGSGAGGGSDGAVVTSVLIGDKVGIAAVICSTGAATEAGFELTVGVNVGRRVRMRDRPAADSEPLPRMPQDRLARASARIPIKKGNR